MIRELKNGFELVYKEQVFIRHTSLNPAFFVGNEELDIDMKNGEFSINNHTVFAPIKKFEIKGNQIICSHFTITVSEDDHFYLQISELATPLKIRIVADQTEQVFGMGEQFTELNLRGNIVRNWVEEHITRKQIYNKILRRLVGLKPKKWPFEYYKTYFVIPAFVSSNHYFLHTNTKGYALFDFQNQEFHELTFYHDISTIVIDSSETLIDTVAKLSKFQGITPKLPEWIYDGVIVAIQGGSQVVDEKLQLLQDHGVKVSGVWSQDWCGELYTFFGKQVFWNWQVDDSLYPDLKLYIKKWNAHGIRFLTYVNPYLNQNGYMYQEALKHHYLVMNQDGSPFLTKATSFEFGLIDLTNQKAYNWFKSIIKSNYLDLGISGWMADFGEYLPLDCLLAQGTGKEMHNQWPDLWAKLNREVLEENNQLGKAIFFNRAGYTNNLKYTTLIWNGDQHVDFTNDFGMPSALRAKLGLAFSGVGISHSDIGGYTTVPAIKRTKRIYFRWLEMNAFTPVMRMHEGNKPWKNVQFDSSEEAMHQTKRYVNIHVMLKPYFQHTEDEYHKKTYPMIRPVMLHYDMMTDSMFLVGKDLLVCPVMNRKRKQQITLPKDEWIDLFTGQKYSSGKHQIEIPLQVIPVYYRKSSKFASLFEQITEYIVNNK